MRLPWLTLSLVGIFLVMQIIGFAHQEWFWLDRDDPLAAWRWVTGQWIHTDSTHAFMNGLALLGFGAWVEQYSRRAVAVGLALGMLAVVLWFFAVDSLSLYVGLSGALNTLLVMGLGMTTFHARSSNDRVLLTVMILGAAWTLFHISTELFLDVRWMHVGAWAAAPGAHAAGWVAGLAWWAYQWYMHKTNHKDVLWLFQKPIA